MRVHIFALVIRYANCTSSALCYTVIVACLDLPWFSALARKWHAFRERIIEHKMRVFILSTILSETFFLLRIIQRSTVTMYVRIHVKYLLFLSDFNETWIFSTYFKKYSNINFHENPSRGSRVFPCQQTSMTKLTVTFRNFAKLLKNWTFPQLISELKWRLGEKQG